MYFTHGTDLDEGTPARFAARSIRIAETEVREVVEGDGALAGLRLADDTFAARRVSAVATRSQTRTEGPDGLKPPMEDLPLTMGRRFASATAGTPDATGVGVAGNATDPTTQVGASAAAGAHVTAPPATADIDTALAAARAAITPDSPSA